MQKKSVLHTRYTENLSTYITAILFIVVIFVSSCSGEKKEVVSAFSDETETPTIKTLDVNSLYSDTGVPRYRMIAKEWLMYEKSRDPYWLFPEGLYVEKFDSLLQAEAYVQCDTAWFYKNKDLWELAGNVEVKNLNGRRLFTQRLFWDRIKKKIYSEVDVLVEDEDGTFMESGKGFDSDERMENFIFREMIDGDAGYISFQKKVASDSLLAAQSDSLRVDSVERVDTVKSE